MISLNRLKLAYDNSKAYLDSIRASDWMTGRKDLSAFWAEHFNSRQNFPTFNDILCFRRGSYTYGLGDRDLNEIDIRKEQVHAETAFWNMSQTVPKEYWSRVSESAIGSPISFEFQGQRWSSGGITCALTAYRIIEACKRHGLDQRRLRVLEIGAGYGQAAYQLISQLPIETYAICDLPENLFLSSFYLQANFPERAVSFVADNKDSSEDAGLIFGIPPFLENISGKFDLILNSYSYQEMNLESVQEYFEFAQRRLKPDGIFYSLNAHGKAGVQTPMDYQIENFDFQSFGIPRRYPFQIFATTPYEIVLKPRSSTNSPIKKSQFTALAYLSQLGMDADLNKIHERFSSGSLTADEEKKLDLICTFFQSSDLSKRRSILKELEAIPSLELPAAYLSAALAFVSMDWKSAFVTLRKLTSEVSDSHAKILCYLMLFLSSLNLGEKTEAVSAIEKAENLAPLLTSELRFWQNHPENLIDAVSRLFGVPSARQPNRIHRILSRARRKLRSTVTWQESVGYS